jgi:hypothetical protein
MTNWMKDAPCVGYGHLFFDESRSRVVNEARKICAGCGLNDECLDHALRNSEVGVWAGLTTNQRRKLIRSRTKSQTDLEKIV